MKQKRFSRFFAVFLILLLCFSMFQSVGTRVKAAADDATSLTKGQEFDASFNSSEQVHWYKVDPTSDDLQGDSHFNIQLTSEKEMTISVYPSLEKAKNDDTYDLYRSYSGLDMPAKISFPLAWTGPYYIKVEYYGWAEGEYKEDPESEEAATADYTIKVEGTKSGPSDGIIGETCPVELSTVKKNASKEILSTLRTIRDSLLAQTEEGKELSTLYYKTAPFLVTKMALSKETRETVYQDLVDLKPIFKELATNGANSSYKLTSDDQDAINRLYELVMNSIPDSLKDDVEEIASKVDLSKLIGLRLSTVLDKAGLAPDTEVNTNKLIVKFKNGKGLSNFSVKAKEISGKSTISPLKAKDELFDNMFVMELEKDSKYSSMEKQWKVTAQQISKLPEVEFVERVQIYQSLTSDIQYSKQWSLNNTGEDVGQEGADIKFAPLQDVINGEQLEDSFIAVLDSGVDHTLADLKDHVRTDLGWNFVSRNSDAYDDFGHGTHVAGIIAADTNNNFSMAGINTAAQIIPVKVLDSTGSGDTESIASGIKYAVDKGAKVINLSLGGSYSRVVETALKYADSKGVTIVAASGNDQMPTLSYPASSKYVLAVGATNRNDIVSDYSNYGAGLDLVAPGTDIPSLLPNGNVTYMDGTSMAAPHVAAVAGLLISQKPSIGKSEVEKILTETADNIAFEEADNGEIYYDVEVPVDEIPIEDLPIDEEGPIGDYPTVETIPGYDTVSGWGRLNAYSAISTLELSLKIDSLLDNQNVVTGTAKSGTKVTIKNDSGNIGSGTADANGKFRVKIPVQASKQVLYAVATKGAATASVRLVVEEGIAPSAPKVYAMSNKDTYVTGKSSPNLTISVKNASEKVIATGSTDSKGVFKVKISKQKAGTVLYITAIDLAKRESSSVKIKVQDKIAPSAPKVSTVSDRDTTIKGKTEAYAQVTIKRGEKKIGSKKANNKGEYTIKIAKQKAGTILHVITRDSAGNTSKSTKVTIKDKTAPAAPKVFAINDQDTSLRGKTEANATVTVKKNGKVIKVKKANSKGVYTIKISKQKAETTLYITAKDAAGNNSKTTKVTIKKAKK